MFTKAAKRVLDWIFPILTIRQNTEGKFICGCGTGFIINKEGFFMSAGHVLDARGERIAYWTGTIRDNIEMYTLDQNADLAVGKLKDARGVVSGNSYPSFAKHADMDVPLGKSMCVAGYPLNDVRPGLDKDNETVIPSSQTFHEAAPYFVEGIFSRAVRSPVTFENTTVRVVHLADLTAHGLPGQSGGPAFDKDAIIYGTVIRRSYGSEGFPGATAAYWPTLCDLLDNFGVRYETQQKS